MKTIANFLTIAALATCMTVNAENLLTVKNLSVKSGEPGSLVIELDNSEEIQSVSFDILKIDGISFDKNALSKKILYSSDILKDADFQFSIIENDAYVSVTIYSDAMGIPEGFSKEYGPLISFPFKSTVDYNGTPLVANVNASTSGATQEIKYVAGYVGKNGYSSFSSSEDILIEGATAYYGVLSEDGTLVTLAPVEGAIKHDNGAILKGKEGDPIYATSVAETEDAAVNDLLASTRKGITVENVHVLTTEKDAASGKNVTGFYKYSGYIPCGKAYLEGASSSNGAPLRVVIEDVNGIQEVAAEDLDGVIFNLSGQKVNEAKKGIYVVNGKKVMF